jgi:hypothetical protein
MPALDPKLLRATPARKSPWGAKNHGCPGRRDADGGRARLVRALRANGKTTAARTRPCCSAMKKAGGIVNNNANTMARQCGEVAGRRTETIGPPWNHSRNGAGRGWCSAAWQTDAAKITMAGTITENTPMELGVHGAAALCARGRIIVDASRSLLIAPAYFGAASAEGAFALGAAFFLPFVGATGSSCA